MSNSEIAAIYGCPIGDKDISKDPMRAKSVQ